MYNIPRLVKCLINVDNMIVHDIKSQFLVVLTLMSVDR